MTVSLRKMLPVTAALAILSTAPAFAHGPGTGQQYPMGPGMMGYGMMAPRMMGPSMMGPSMMGPSMMGPSMMGPGMMGPGMMGPGMMGYGWWPQSGPADRDLSADDVRRTLEQRLAWQGNKRLKVGDVKEADENTITADIVTVDGSLVERYKIDRLNGVTQPVQ